MSYLVLARKWRPSTFDEVVGQGHVTRTLKNAIELGRVAHALLFTGSRGVGKTSCARILAKALNCQHGPTTTPCGKCPACTEIGNGTSVDVFEIDGASNNSVEQIREIRESVKFLPTRGKRKMYIIDEVHMLSTSAFNALLKTLEEPPEHVLFVFATTEPHKIPDTIISRCQRYDFKRIPERDIVDAIGGIAAKEGVVVEQAALHHIAREARGGMRDSLSLLDQVIAFCGTTISEAQTREVLGIADRQVLHHLTAAVFEGDGQRALEIIDHLFRFGLDLQKFASEFVQHLRDLMVVKVCADPERLVDVAPDEVEAMAALVRPVDPARIHRVFNALLQGADEVARSPFPKLVLEMTLLRLCHQGATLPLAEVLGGLARLEARLGDAVTAPGPAAAASTPAPARPRRLRPARRPGPRRFDPGAGPARGGVDPGAGPAFAGSSAAGGQLA
ncbi:MAG: DNA polymerase III subunit gamma/tau [Myxococcales bacterium]|nr:DNA polymerase III subunit gamma/tau [Myxococcales bacterium]